MSSFLQWNPGSYSADNYRFTGGQLYNIKPKHLFYVEFNIQGTKDKLNGGQAVRSLSFKVKNTDRPNFSYSIQTLNEYNRPRGVHTKIEYNNFNITFNDTVDGEAIKFINDYNKFYFGDFNGKSPKNWKWDVLPGSDSTPLWGTKTTQQTNFLESVSIYEFFQSKYSQYDLMNPKLISSSLSQNDIADAANNEVSMSFKPEGVIFRAIGQQLSSSIANKFGIPFGKSSTKNFRSAGSDNQGDPSLPDIIGNGFNIGPDLISNLIGNNSFAPIFDNVFNTSPVNALIDGSNYFGLQEVGSNFVSGISSSISGDNISDDTITWLNPQIIS